MIKNVIFSFFLIAVSSPRTASAVEIYINTTLAPDLFNFGEIVRTTLLEWFDSVETVLHSPTYVSPSAINVFFDPEYDGVAYASGNQIVGSVEYYRNNPSDLGSMVHEMAHVIQSYRSCYTEDDWWITEGIADWVRFYHYEPHNAPAKPRPDQHYSNGYRVTAYFLKFINDRFDPMIYWVNKDCREGTYNHEIFPRLTGKTLDEHWEDMMNSLKDDLLPRQGVEDGFNGLDDGSSNPAEKCLERR